MILNGGAELKLMFGDMRKHVNDNMNVKQLLDGRFHIKTDLAPAGDHYTQIRLIGLHDEFRDLLQLSPKELPVEFALSDATVHAFEPGRADLLCSRFGLMFFADPARSFANLRRGLRAGARLAFTCWRQARENPWMMLPLQEAYRYVPRLPEVGPEDPGPFSLADERRVRRILELAGFTAVDLEAIDLRLDLANGRGLDAAVDTALDIGPASRALDNQPADLRQAAAESIRAALARHQVGASVPLPAALWVVTASNP